MSEATEAAMRRALALAERGPDRGVNPRVGCVLLGPDGAVVGEGWHEGAGTPHAEVAALRAAGAAAAGATAVVTLEPCSHTGRTGPCVDALLAAGVAEVVYAVADPGPRAGGGAARLAAAGVRTRSGVLGAEAERLLGDWLPYAALGRPVVTVKWASTLDGRAAAADGSSRWITGPQARADVHRRRAASDAILVGTGTVLADDPALTARRDGGGLAERQPLPVVAGRTAVPADAAVRSHPRALRTIAGDDLAADLAALGADGVRSVFVEGGPTLASAVLAAGLADRLLVYLAPALLGGPVLAIGDLGAGNIADAVRLDVEDLIRLGDDILVVAAPKGASARVHWDH